jgi:hypothetical protein
MEDLEGFFGDYLARNEPDKILCRAVTFCQKVKWWTLERLEYWIASCFAMTGT